MSADVTSRDEVARVGARVRAAHSLDHPVAVPGVVVALSRFGPVATVRFADGWLRLVPLRRLVLDVDPEAPAADRTTAKPSRVPGARRLRWPEDRIIAAVKAWAAEHGRPPAVDEWKRAAPDHPSSTTVVNRFGSWLACMARSDQPPLRVGARKKT